MTTATQTDVAAVVAAFALTDAEIEALAKTIYETARIPTYTARYQRAAQTLKVTLPANWQPSDAALSRLASAALKSAKGIAATYRADLEAQAQKLAAEETEDKAYKGLGQWVRKLAEWARHRAVSKSVAVANYEASQAGDDGTGDFLESLDYFGGDIEPGVDLNTVKITVLPEESSGDECAEFAGQEFTLDDYDSIPSWPMHEFCPHETVIYLE